MHTHKTDRAIASRKLTAKKEELLDIFPLKLPSLDVVTAGNREDYLHAMYIQQPTFDPYTDSDEKYPMPDRLMMPEKQRMVLRAELERENPRTVYMIYYQRNNDSWFKGIGAMYFPLLCTWLKDRGFNYLLLAPLNERLEGWWQEQGLLPLTKVPGGQRRELRNPGRESNVHVRFLDDDVHEFYKQRSVR